MNWLGHYAILPPGAAPLTVIGGALADLGHDLKPRLRAPALIDALAGRDDDTARQLSLGVRWHLAADTVFHDDPVVMAKMTAVRLKLHASEFSALPRRREFIAHLMVEMALDAAFVAADPELPNRFCANFTQPHRAAAVEQLRSAFGDRHADAGELLEKFAARIPNFADQRPETLAQRLGWTMTFRLALPPEDLPAKPLAELFAETIVGWRNDVDGLSAKLWKALT